jgi:nucleotide-binding universal stress UspA family protein
LSPNAGTILAAVSGGQAGWEALEWAAAESAACKSALRIVHVVAAATPLFDPAVGMVVEWHESVQSQRAASVLQEAVQRARLVAPDIPISTHLESGAVAASIRNAARHDSLIVVGRGHPRRLGVSPLSWRVARSAPTTVAVVELQSARTRGPSGGRVVLAIDAKGGPPTAVEYAFEAAARRGTGLTVLDGWEHCVEPVCSSAIDVIHLDSQTCPHEDSLLSFRSTHPQVDVRHRHVVRSAGAALVEESRAAALLVIGARRQCRIHQALFGSLPHNAFRCALSPVVITRPSA